MIVTVSNTASAATPMLQLPVELITEVLHLLPDCRDLVVVCNTCQIFRCCGMPLLQQRYTRYHALDCSDLSCNIQQRLSLAQVVPRVGGSELETFAVIQGRLYYVGYQPTVQLNPVTSLDDIEPSCRALLSGRLYYVGYQPTPGTRLDDSRTLMSGLLYYNYAESYPLQRIPVTGLDDIGPCCQVGWYHRDRFLLLTRNRAVYYVHIDLGPRKYRGTSVQCAPNIVHATKYELMLNDVVLLGAGFATFLLTTTGQVYYIGEDSKWQPQLLALPEPIITIDNSSDLSVVVTIEGRVLLVRVYETQLEVCPVDSESRFIDARLQINNEHYATLLLVDRRRQVHLARVAQPDSDSDTTASVYTPSDSSDSSDCDPSLSTIAADFNRMLQPTTVQLPPYHQLYLDEEEFCVMTTTGLGCYNYETLQAKWFTGAGVPLSVVTTKPQYTVIGLTPDGNEELLPLQKAAGLTH